MNPDPKNINERGIWLGKLIFFKHFYDAQLSLTLLNFFKKEQAESVVDFGCGLGDYVRFFQEHELPTEGYDGNPSTPELTQGRCGILDLSEPFDLHKQFDWVLSLEVGEHIPKKYEHIFIQNLIKHFKKGIVLSWAIKDLGGYGHVNEQNNDYIKNIFAQAGFVNDINAENMLRESSTLPWFKKTIMVFRKSS